MNAAATADEILSALHWIKQNMPRCTATIPKGERFGMLTVVRERTGRTVYCKCSCGSSGLIAWIDNLKSGKQTDCRGIAHGVAARIVSGSSEG